jgi:hypothetical protein
MGVRWPAFAIADDPRTPTVPISSRSIVSGHPSKTAPACSPRAANARAHSVRYYCPRFAHFGTPTSVNTNRDLSVTQALTSGHDTLISVPVPSFGFHSLPRYQYSLCGRPIPQHLSCSHVGRFVNSVQSSCRQFTKTSSAVHETSDTDRAFSGVAFVG